jgi:hypothetical protein
LPKKLKLKESFLQEHLAEVKNQVSPITIKTADFFAENIKYEEQQLARLEMLLKSNLKPNLSEEETIKRFVFCTLTATLGDEFSKKAEFSQMVQVIANNYAQIKNVKKSILKAASSVLKNQLNLTGKILH